MNYLTTYEGFFDFFKKKEPMESIVKRYPLAEMREILMEVADDFNLEINNSISMVSFTNKRSVMETYHTPKFAHTKNGSKYYYDWSTRDVANAYLVKITSFSDGINGEFKKSDYTYNHLNEILKHKSEIYKFKYIILTKVIDIDNFYAAIIY